MKYLLANRYLLWAAAPIRPLLVRITLHSAALVAAAAATDLLSWRPNWICTLVYSIHILSNEMEIGESRGIHLTMLNTIGVSIWINSFNLCSLDLCAGYSFCCRSAKNTKVVPYSATKHWPRVSSEWMQYCRNQWTWPWSWRRVAKLAGKVVRWLHCERNVCHRFRWTMITRIIIAFYWLVSIIFSNAVCVCWQFVWDKQMDSVWK